MIFLQILMVLLGTIFFVGFCLLVYDTIKSWKKIWWTKKCYNIIIAFAVLLAAIRAIYMGFNW